MSAPAPVEVGISASAARRVRAGHPWVFASDVRTRGGDAEVARVCDERGRLLGTALYAPAAPIVLRMLGPGELRFDDELLRARLAAAWQRRRAIYAAAGDDAFRWVHGEADLLPGLFVDWYGDVAVIETGTRAMDARKAEIAALLAELTPLRLVVARDDGSMRDFEQLPRESRILRGGGATEVRYHDAGNAFVVDVMQDGKTGAFLDQRENHARARAYAAGARSALDAFSYHGGFALALARGGAREVLALDENPRAVERIRANAAANGLGGVSAERDNAFDALRRLEGEGRRFDVVVVDPPALAKRKSAHGLAARTGASGAERAYKELTLRALRLCNPGGVVITCSCSGKMTPALFGEVVQSAVADVGRPVQLLERTGAGRDHPPLVGVPETEYLKCWFLRVL